MMNLLKRMRAVRQLWWRHHLIVDDHHDFADALSMLCQFGEAAESHVSSRQTTFLNLRVPRGAVGHRQNRKYRCAIGSSVAGSHVSSMPSARTS